MVDVPMFDRVHKDWFNVCLCLWLVKIIVLPESGHDSLARRSFSILRILFVCCFSRCEIFQFHLVTFCFYGMSLRRSGVGFCRLVMILSSQQLCSDNAQNMMKPIAPQVVRNMSGAFILSVRLRRGDCVNLFFLLGQRYDFNVVHNIIDNRHRSRYDAHAGIEH